MSLLHYEHFRIGNVMVFSSSEVINHMLAEC